MSELPPANANEPGEAAEERHPAPSQPAASPPALARRWSEIRSDLPLVALLLLLPLLLNVLASRALAAFHAYPYAERPAVVAILLRSPRAAGVALSALTLAILAVAE